MNDLELAVRTIENILPDMPTERVQKWKGILETALVKVDAELESVAEHTCSICASKEFGYRTELPAGWRERGDLIICFQHEDTEIAEAIETALAADKANEPSEEETLEELMAAI